jgi:hypothetical protein
MHLNSVTWFPAANISPVPDFWGLHPISTSDGKRALATSHINSCYSQQ